MRAGTDERVHASERLFFLRIDNTCLSQQRQRTAPRILRIRESTSSRQCDSASPRDRLQGNTHLDHSVVEIGRDGAEGCGAVVYGLLHRAVDVEPLAGSS